MRASVQTLGWTSGYSSNLLPAGQGAAQKIMRQTGGAQKNIGRKIMKIRLVIAMMLLGTAALAQTPPQPAPAAQELLPGEPETQLQDRPQRRPAAEVPQDTQTNEPLGNMATGVSID